MSKVIQDIHTAFENLEHARMTVLVGGFGLCAIPEHAIEAIRTKGLTVMNKPDLIDLGFRSYQNIRFELEHKNTLTISFQKI